MNKYVFIKPKFENRTIFLFGHKILSILLENPLYKG